MTVEQMIAVYIVAAIASVAMAAYTVYAVRHDEKEAMMEELK